LEHPGRVSVASAVGEGAFEEAVLAATNKPSRGVGAGGDAKADEPPHPRAKTRVKKVLSGRRRRRVRGDGEAARVASRRNGELAREEERRGFHLDEDVACVLLVHASDLPTHAQKRELEAARGNRGKAAGVFEEGAFPLPSLLSVSHQSSWRGHVITSSIAKPVCIKKTRTVPILNVHENRPATEVRNGEAKRT